MLHEPVVAIVIAVVALLLVAATATIGFRRIHLPYTIGLVIVGLLLGSLAKHVEALEPLQTFSLSPEIILFIFLPTLIFESAFNMDSRLLSQNLTPVLALAAPGILISTAIVGGLVTLATPLPLGPALLFGALISATDPVAVIALFKELRAPKRLSILVEGESLFNDATAIVLFRIILAVLAAGSFGGGTIGQGIADFVIVFAGGLLVGAGIGYLMVCSIALGEDDPLIEVSLSTVVAYAAFIAAEHYLHVSGVMATVAAGVVVGGYGSTRFTPEAKVYLRQFWEYAAFVANSLIFLLVGLSVDLASLSGYLGPIGWAIVAAMLARGATVFGLVPMLGRLPGAEPIDWRYQSMIFWGGLRGAVALALALSIPVSFPHRELIVALAIGVVLFTLLTGGLTVGWLMRALGLDQPSLVERVARAQAVAAAKREALSRVSAMASAGHFSGRLIENLEGEYQNAEAAAQQTLAALRAEPEFHTGTMQQVLHAEALTVERRTYRDLFDEGVISEPVLEELELAVDLERDALRRGKIPERRAAIPFEVRVEGWAMRVIERVAPRSGVVQRHHVRTFSAKYEHDAAVLEASKRVSAELARLAELSGVDASVMEECRRTYEQRGREAMQRLDGIAEHFPEYVEAVQQLTVRRIALDGEADAIERLAASGGIPDAVAAEARRAVQTAGRKLARQRLAEFAPKPEELLLRVPFFQKLSADDLQKVVDNLMPRTLLAGETIIRQGEQNPSLFLIARGVVGVFAAQDDQPPQRVATFHAGEFFGEMTLLDREAQSPTIQAVTDCQLLELGKPDLDALCETCAGIRDALSQAVRAREQEREIL